MGDSAFNLLTQIREDQKKAEEAAVDKIVQDSKDDFQRRLDSAKLDTTINLNEEEK